MPIRVPMLIRVPKAVYGYKEYYRLTFVGR